MGCQTCKGSDHETADHIEYCFTNPTTGEPYPVPDDIRAAATALVRAYGICGMCDPMYVANVIANALGVGDGESRFVDPSDRWNPDAIRGQYIGRRATVRGGFEDGASGWIVANEPDRTRQNPYSTDRPYRYRLLLDDRMNDRFRTIGGLHPVALELEPCAYCGEGPCSGTAHTANGSDLERYERIHAEGRAVVAGWLADGMPR